MLFCILIQIPIYIMKKNFLMLTIAAAGISACNGGNAQSNTETTTTVKDTVIKQASIQEEDASYPEDTTTAISFIAYDKNAKGPLPVVMVLPEWWGLNDYPKMRARELAKLGYFAMAVDLFGQRRVGQTPDEAGKLAGAFYKDTTLLKNRLNAALAKVHSYPQAEANKIAMIGYCFGGSMALTGAKMHLPVRGVASFHGGLKGTASKTVPMLICQGEADKMVTPEEVTAWRKSMDSLGADYAFKSYPGATHAFSNPAATATGKKFNMPIEYNEAADKGSWDELKMFLKKIF